MKPLVYIAGPYTHPDPVTNVRRAIDVAEQLDERECAVFIPHLSMLWHLVRPSPVIVWYRRDLDVLAHCDALVRFSGWSIGADDEVADAEFSERQRRRLSRQYGYGHRPVNHWGDGDLPAPWAEGDLVVMREGADNDRMRGLGRGYFVVSCAFSIDEGDAWYFRVSNSPYAVASDRMHVVFAERCAWDTSVDWMASFELVETADPEGLALRESMLAAGWAPPSPFDVCSKCGAHL